jgi:hypothetical protein
MNIDIKRIAINTGGGDAPGLNTVIHGEDGPRVVLANLIQQCHGPTPSLPKQGDVIEV